MFDTPNLAFCIGCACDDLHACEDPKTGLGCTWLACDRGARVGVCSCCPTHLQRWKAGERNIAAIQCREQLTVLPAKAGLLEIDQALVRVIGYFGRRREAATRAAGRIIGAGKEAARQIQALRNEAALWDSAQKRLFSSVRPKARRRSASSPEGAPGR